MVAMDERTSGSETQITYQDFLKTGPGTLAGRYLRSFWQPVALARDIADGRTKPLRIMSEDFTLARSASGKVQVLAQRCAHRGAALVTGWFEGEILRCSYHGWAYDLNGQCVEQPAETVPFCNSVRVRAYPTEEYLGLIFAYLGEGEAPAFPYLRDFEDPSYLRDVECLVWPCNYFTQLDNSMDPMHTTIAHWQFDRGMPEELVFAETDWGMQCAGKNGDRVGPPSHFTMPNSHEWGGAPRGDKVVWNYARGWRVPLDDEHHLRFGLEVIISKGDAAQRRLSRRVGDAPVPMEAIAEDVLAGRQRSRDLSAEQYPEHQLTNIQDYYNLVGLGDIANHPVSERLGRSDRALIYLRHIWARELKALAEGRPTKQWTRPDSLWEHVRAAAANHVAN